jgi:hypothetical protein
MNYKEIELAQLENDKLYENKLISKQEYLKKQVEIIEELGILLDKLNRFNFDIFKNIKWGFIKQLNSILKKL